MELNTALGNAARCLLALNVDIVGTGRHQDELGQFSEFDIVYDGRQFVIFGYENKEYLEFVVHCRLSFAFSGWIDDEEIDNHLAEFERENLDENEQQRVIRQQLAAQRVVELGDEHGDVFETLQDDMSSRPSRTTYLPVQIDGNDTLDGVTLRRRIHPTDSDIEVAEFGEALDEFANDYERVETVLTSLSVFDEHQKDQESVGKEPVDSGGEEEKPETPGFQ